jgi:hypothetical protein
MTPQEAISSVPKDVLARANLAADPIAALNQEMGWTASQSASMAASQAINQGKSSGALRQTYAEMIPDDVLARAQATSNPAAAVAKEMGWSMSGAQAGGIYDALDYFEAASTPAVAATGAQSFTNLGVSAGDANVLTSNGFTPQDVSNLTKLGYAVTDLADMASVGVTPQTLTNLANGALPEATINNLLTNGISANTIGAANQFIATGSLTAANAEQLMNKGWDQYGIRNIAVNGKADQVLAASNAGVSNSTIDQLINNGYDLNKVTTSINNGTTTAANVNELASGTNWKNDLNNALTPTPTSSGSTTTGPVNPANIPTGNLPSLDSMWSKYDLVDTFNPATNDISSMNLNSDGFADNLLKEQYGSQVNNGVISNAGNPNTAYYKNLEAAYQTSNPEQFLASKGYNQSTVDQLMDYYDAKSYAQSQYQSQQVASGYTPAQEAQYNELIKAGMTPADAVNQIANTPQAPTQVDVSGGAGFSGNPTGAIPEYRTPNTDLATQAQIDSGAAQYNAGANAWEVPTPQVPTTPIVPVIVPPVVQPPAPTPVTPTQPVTPPAPVVTPPAPVVTPPAPVVTPPAPVVTPPAPAPVTTVSSSTRTTSDGSVYKDDQKSDGTVVTTLISGPTGSGSGTGTGTGTTPTTPVQPPLTPPTPVVIPPDTSYVAPVEVAPVTPQEPVVTPPTTTPPTVPIVPIVPPVDTPVPEEDNYRGKYTWGTAPKVNIPTGLNPGWMAPQPFYKNTTDAQAQYYWGAHPYQPGPTFNSQLYNTVPQAPATPWGATNAPRAATSQEILAKMGNYYPLLGNTGPVKP